PHLHFEIRTGPNYGSDVSPLPYLRKQGIDI
ncbi:peptidase M23, partial [Streptomyces sp. NPDC006334]